MVSGGAFICAALAIGLLIGSGFWADSRYHRFDRIPAHYDIAGKPTRYASRRFVVWLTPAIFVALILGMTALVKVSSSEQINGDPDIGVATASAIIVASQGFILWLTERWARGQSSET